MAIHYEYYRAYRNRAIAPTPPIPGTLLIGGAEGDTSGEDAATRWFLDRARGGRYLVLRVGGIKGQADWIGQHYGDWVYSAAELSIDSRGAANHPDVVDYIRDADALFIAGGDQNAYQELWAGTATEEAINDLIHEKRIPIAGTSAGMAILGDHYYAPDHRGLLSSEILNDPFHFNTETIHHSDFIQVPYLRHVLTDTHLDRINEGNPETRYGRLLGLLARVVFDRDDLNSYAIGLEEGAFVAIDDRGMATVFGNGTRAGQDAYFLQTNGAFPEQLQPGWPLIWDHGGQAVKVYRLAGTPDGSGAFDLTNWTNASGGTWEYWYTTGGKSGLRKSVLQDC